MSEQKSDWQEDAITEPPNSTVDDWLGQRVGRDEQRVDDTLAETGGDESEAKRRFEEQTERRPDEPVATDEPDATDDAGFGFGESDIPDPMPEELRDVPDQTEAVESMEGESPTG